MHARRQSLAWILEPRGRACLGFRDWAGTWLLLLYFAGEVAEVVGQQVTRKRRQIHIYTITHGSFQSFLFRRSPCPGDDRGRNRKISLFTDRHVDHSRDIGAR